MLVFHFSLFYFDYFLATLAKNFMEKPLLFITDIKSSDKFLLSYKNLRSRYVSQ